MAEEQRILLTQAQAGMTLARPVALPSKLVLCPRGMTLSDQMILRLMQRGIKRVYVRGHPVPAPRPESYSERIAGLRERFRRTRHIAMMSALESLVEREIVRRS